MCGLTFAAKPHNPIGQWPDSREGREEDKGKTFRHGAPPEGVAVRKHLHVSDITQAENGLHWPPTR